MYNAGIYHRDISRHNLIIVRRAGSSVGEGYVIDFDCAASVSHLQEGKVRPIVCIEADGISEQLLTRNAGNSSLHGHIDSKK